ncbi:hypothetical protein PAXRUDRAFT_180652 [Paxillus rubicundulus Ve08.2h10]|uniref:Unplaced genomic scaffold scaffold_5999, whole genome shotgun sequence n=1 Tax=Paxillus rubicundulus Ve08.2h10 TaxID=930991 RepID=A0A0D0CNV7_9AGAM|nr:hypothetical protein PAXRUDRAFT_180652 [Paxillus rubicundulus Ve08.2h10]
MDLKLSELDPLLHYLSVHLMTIQEQSSRPDKTPLDPTPEPYALFWLEELRVTRRAVTLMAVHGLPHRLPGPLWALGPQFIAPELDGQAAKIAVLDGMKADDCEDLKDDKKAGLPWQDAWWLPGAPPLASDYGSRSMEHFAHVAVMRCGMTFRSCFRLGQIPALRLKLMKSELVAAYEAHRRASRDTELRLAHKLERIGQLADAFGFEELLLASMDGRF